MYTMIDYVKWRGDLPFSKSELNPVDILVLCQISYIHFEGIIPNKIGVKHGISLQDAKNAYFSGKRNEKYLGFLSDQTYDIFKEAADSSRFGNLIVSGYVSTFDEEKEMQFAAMTFHWKDMNIVIFRGTDNTIIGWKEDFNMVYMSPIPAQLESVKYLQQVGKNTRGKIITAGHSKGGNLAIYSATKTDNRIKRRITGIYNYDGPGFTREYLESPDYLSVSDLIKSYTPYASVVGALMEHSKDALVVNSRNSGIMQHDTASWGICGTKFDTVDRVSEKSRFFQTTLGDWLSTISTEERETFINSFFSVIEETNAKTIEDLTANWYKSTTAAIKLLTKLDSSIREHLFKAIQIIFEASRIPESHKEKE